MNAVNFYDQTHCFEALFTQLTVEDQTNDSKYIIYMYRTNSADNYSYRIYIISTEIYIIS